MKHSAKVILVKGGRLLMVKRNKDGLWTLPGGKQRRLESPKACLLREVGEELPLVKLEEVRRWRQLQRKTSNGMKRQVVYRARFAGGALAIGDKTELSKAEWRHPGETHLAQTARRSSVSYSGGAE